jgi:hypothetical protein
MSLPIRQVRALLAAFLLVFAIGCGGDQIWSAESRSDDWIAKAHTVEYSGFGTGSGETTVWIERANKAWWERWESPHQVLGFANGGDAIGLKMRWDGPEHLVVVYNADPKLLYFQVLKTSGVDISVQNLWIEQQGANPSTRN